MDDSIEHVVQKQRKIPYNLRQKAPEEEKRLQNLGITEDVPDDVPTTWVTNPVIALKPNNPDAICYCTNMRHPNVAIKTPITEVPQIELEEESRHFLWSKW